MARVTLMTGANDTNDFVWAEPDFKTESFFFSFNMSAAEEICGSIEKKFPAGMPLIYVDNAASNCKHQSAVPLQTYQINRNEGHIS